MEKRCMKSFIPLLLTLSLATHAVCQNAELNKLFELPANSRGEELYQRREAPQNTFPFYVSIKRKPRGKDGDHFCAGTLISPHYILTSAACVDSEEIGPVFARQIIVDIGTHSLDSPEDGETGTKSGRRRGYKAEYGMKVERIIPHEKYSNGQDGQPPYDARYDIALLKLKEPSKLCWALLPLAESDCCSDEDFLNVGLGREESDNSAYVKTLEMAVFPYMPHKQCAAYFKKTEPDNEFFGTGNSGNLTEGVSLCVSGEGQYCQLDHGSSLVRYAGSIEDYKAFGLANKATGQCSSGAPYVFLSVAFHVGWILSQKGIGEEISQASQRATICRSQYEHKPLVGQGEYAVPGAYPFATSIRLTKSLSFHRCQGVLIGPRHVITAASCIPDKAYNESRRITAYIGGLHINPKLDSDVNHGHKSELIRASEIIPHPKYGAKKNAVNLAIVVLKKKSKKTPVLLPAQNRTSCTDGTNVRLFGWGSTKPNGSPVLQLQVGATTCISRKRCISKFDVENVHPKAVCAATSNLGATLCKGDDGTPLVVANGLEHILVGVGTTNTDTPCGEAPSEFLQIADFMGWIKRHVPAN